jgi:exoribonuclease R
VRDIVKYEMIYLLEAADYFTVGDSEPASWIHYALNSPVYTHFTSPIRRYPDILVHRQLASILDGKKNFKVIPKELTDLCNEKKLQAKRVSNGCEKVYNHIFRSLLAYFYVKMK